MVALELRVLPTVQPHRCHRASMEERNVLPTRSVKIQRDSPVAREETTLPPTVRRSIGVAVFREVPAPIVPTVAVAARVITL